MATNPTNLSNPTPPRPAPNPSPSSVDARGYTYQQYLDAADAGMKVEDWVKRERERERERKEIQIFGIKAPIKTVVGVSLISVVLFLIFK